MIFLDDLKKFKLYKREFCIPYDKADKRKGAAIFLLTPSYDISSSLMNNTFAIDKLKTFVSYYIERDISHLINNEGYLTTAYYDDIIHESANGNIPSFEENTGVLFNSINQYQHENTILPPEDDIEITNEYYRFGNKVTFFNDIVEETYLNEAESESKLNSKYKLMLYHDRLRTMKDVIQLYDKNTETNPWIKYSYPILERYKRRNLYIDLYYYNQTYLANSNFTMIKSLEMYKVYLKRLLSDKRYIDAGYNKFTIYIPVYGWGGDPKIPVYDYKTKLNPISLIYKKLKLTPSELNIFKDKEIIFFGHKGYFRFTVEDIPANFHMRFKRFIDILESNVEIGEDSDEPIETSASIAAEIIEDIEAGTGAKIDNLTGRSVDKNTKTKDIESDTSPSIPEVDMQKAIGSASNDIKRAEALKVATKKAIEDTNIISDKEETKLALVRKINSAAAMARSKDDALESLNDDLDVKRLIAELQAESDYGDFKIDATRANRINKVNDALLLKQLKGESIKEMIYNSNKPKELSESSIPIVTINDEWHHMKSVNFEKEYDVDADIVKILYSLSDKHHAYPIAILNVKTEDTSTPEDFKFTYTVNCENYKGDRFTLNFDIPKFRNSRFMHLKGSEKIFSIEMPLLPISKTDNDTAQIATLYKKIFISRTNTSRGKSNPYCDRLIKTLSKCSKSKNIKITAGDNSRVCEKYQLPIDYVDLASTYSKITFYSPAVKENVTIYFNLDEITKVPGISLKNGIPIAMSDSGKVIYYTVSASVPLALFNSNVPELRRATFSEARILNTNIPVIIILAHDIGLTKAMDLAGIKYKIHSKRPPVELDTDMIKLKDGFLTYKITYESTMLMNGLKEIEMNQLTILDLNKKPTWIEALDHFGGRQKSDGLDNFKELMFDPISIEVCKDFKMPTTYHEALIYASNLLVDNKYIRVTNISSNRYRTNEIVAAQFYNVLCSAYHLYSRSAKLNKKATLSIKKTAVIDAILAQNTTTKLSVFQPLLEIEKKNEISFKGYVGLNEEHSYTLDKRGYDKTMENIICHSTNHAANVGINRQTTIDPNITGGRGYFKFSDISKGNVTKSMGMTEALSPYMTTSDDAYRNNMSFTQTSKHSTPIENGMPLLVTTGADQAMPYLSSDMFAFKAKKAGKIIELTKDYILVEYNDKSRDYVILAEQTMHNADGGFYITLQLKTDLKVGYKFKEGEILAWDSKSFSKKVGLNQLAYNVGCLTKIAISTNEDGYEDSGAGSEWLSEAMASDIVTMRPVVLDAKVNLLYLIEKGAQVREGDPVEDDNISLIGRSVVPAKTTGIVSDIKIYRTCDLEDMSENLRKAVEKYEKEVDRLKKIAKGSSGFMQLPTAGKLEQSGHVKNVENGVLIEVYIRYHDKLAIGDKLANLNANKIVLMNVYSNEDAPYTDYRPDEKIDIMSAATSIDGRMVTSPFKNGALNKLLLELQRQCSEIYGRKPMTMHEIYDYFNKK